MRPDEVARWINTLSAEILPPMVRKQVEQAVEKKRIDGRKFSLMLRMVDSADWLGVPELSPRQVGRMHLCWEADSQRALSVKTTRKGEFEEQAREQRELRHAPLTGADDAEKDDRVLSRIFGDRTAGDWLITPQMVLDALQVIAYSAGMDVRKEVLPLLSSQSAMPRDVIAELHTLAYSQEQRYPEHAKYEYESRRGHKVDHSGRFVVPIVDPPNNTECDHWGSTIAQEVDQRKRDYRGRPLVHIRREGRWWAGKIEHPQHADRTYLVSYDEDGTQEVVKESRILHEVFDGELQEPLRRPDPQRRGKSPRSGSRSPRPANVPDLYATTWVVSGGMVEASSDAEVLAWHEQATPRHGKRIGSPQASPDAEVLAWHDQGDHAQGKKPATDVSRDWSRSRVAAFGRHPGTGGHGR